MCSLIIGNQTMQKLNFMLDFEYCMIRLGGIEIIPMKIESDQVV